MGRGGCHSVRNLDRMRCENAGGGSTRRAGQPVTISRRTSAFTDLGPSPDLADSGRGPGVAAVVRQRDQAQGEALPSWRKLGRQYIACKTPAELVGGHAGHAALTACRSPQRQSIRTPADDADSDRNRCCTRRP